MKYIFPADYDERSCYLVAINASLIPMVAGSLRFYEKRGTWLTDADFESGYNAFAALQACFMKCCIDDLIESNDRLYRMLGTAIYGTEYNVVSADPLVVMPAIAPTHALAIEDDESILGRMELQKQLLENALNGVDTPNYSRPDGVRDLLEAIKLALEAGDDLDAEMLAKLVEIALLVA